MPNVLFVSISFPPKSDAECLQTAKYFHYLKQDKELCFEVVTSRIPTLYMSYDEKLEPYAGGYVNQVEVRLRENRWINRLRNRLKLAETVFPDQKQSFHKQAKTVIKQIQKKPDVIYSRSYPISSTILAFKLQQNFNVPWILHLSDPWADAPHHDWSQAYNEKHRQWERKCMEAADVVCLTSEPTVCFYKKKYPFLAHKFLLFPNVYEQKSSAVISVPRLDHLFSLKKLSIVFTGAMADERSPYFFLEPLNNLLQKQPQIAEKLQVIFAGEADFKNRTLFEKYNLCCVEYLGKVSYTEAQYLQQKANLLLVIDNPIEQSEMAMFFPSKLLDYMVARKRILAITTKGSATALVMHDLKGEVIAHQNIQHIENILQNAVREFAAGNLAYFQGVPPPQKYEAKYNAGRLSKLIKEIVNAKKDCDRTGHKA